MLPGGCEVQAEQPSDPPCLPRQVQTLVRTLPSIVVVDLELLDMRHSHLIGPANQ